MTSSTEKILIGCLIYSVLMKTVSSIDCYQCSGTDSEHPFECNEYLDSYTELVPTNCSSIHNAQFCIKHVGRFEGSAIDCYQCNSSGTMECGDALMKLDGGILRAKSCEHVHNALYCIKMTGGISTKRFCSSLDLGNYCHYVQQPGDKLEYRTCLYTCGSDGCNAAAGPARHSLSATLVGALVATLARYMS